MKKPSENSLFLSPTGPLLAVFFFDDSGRLCLARKSSGT